VDDVVDAEAASSSAVKSPAPTASAVDADDAPEGCQMIVMTVKPPIRHKAVAIAAETKATWLRLPCQ
jgi:hypothetical protein